MIFSTTTLLVGLALLPALTLSAPAGSKHNVYLAKCNPSFCPLDLCDSSDDITAAAYLPNGAIDDGSTLTIGKLSGFNPSWEGTKRTVRLGRDGTFTSNISSGAKTAKAGDIVGDATLGDEPFVCFKDGTTKFGITSDAERYTCTASYWCGSIGEK